MDRYTETSYTSYGQNIGNSFKGILVGLLFLVGSIVLIWWNEGHSVKQADALEEMQRSITTLPSAVYDPSLNGKPILVQGEVKPRDKVMDTQFDIVSEGLKLHRKVEMYQWKEERHSQSQDKLGGGTETVTTYEYHKVWSSMPIHSSSFKRAGHENPPMTIESKTFTTDAMLGDFYLDKHVVDKIGTPRPFNGLEKLPDTIGTAKNYKSYLYMGDNPSAPQIGDIKITYYEAPQGVYTFAAAASEKALSPYLASNGTELLFVRYGNVSAQKIFKEELESNAMWTWVWRGAGILLMYVGFAMMMGPIEAFAKVIPALGMLAGGATGIVAAILTLLLGSIVIALAWLGARPMLSLTVIAIGVGAAFMLGKFGKKKIRKATKAQSDTVVERDTPAPTPPPRETSVAKESEDAPTPPERKKEKEASISQPPSKSGE
jgi:hypothetical protein